MWLQSAGFAVYSVQRSGRVVKMERGFRWPSGGRCDVTLTCRKCLLISGQGSVDAGGGVDQGIESSFRTG